MKNKKTLLTIISAALLLALIFSAGRLIAGNISLSKGTESTQLSYGTGGIRLEFISGSLTEADAEAAASPAPVKGESLLEEYEATASASSDSTLYFAGGSKFAYARSFLASKDSRLATLYDQYYSLLSSFASGSIQAKYSSINGVYYIDGSDIVDISAVRAAFGDEAVSSVLTLVLDDNPQFYWTGITQFKNSSSIVIEDKYIDYNTRRSIDLQIAANLASYKALVNDEMSDYEKVLTIHDAILKNAYYPGSSTYNYLSTGSSSDYNSAYHTIVGLLAGDGLANKAVVCAGYAEAFQYILTSLGIENIAVTGYGVGSISSSDTEYHQWNMVRLDGQWYNFDLTWDDGNSRYAYFCVPACSFFDSTHIPSTSAEFGDNYLYDLPQAAAEEHPENTFVYPVGTQIGNVSCSGGSYKYTNLAVYGGSAVTLNKYVVTGVRSAEAVSFYCSSSAGSFVLPAMIAFSSSEEGKDQDGNSTTAFTKSVSGSAVSFTGPTIYAVTGVQELSYDMGNEADLNTADLSAAFFLENIGDSAFADSNLTEVILPSQTVSCDENAVYLGLFKTIGKNAFSGTKLTSFPFNAALTSIGDGAFSGCSLSNADLSQTSVEYIGSNALSGSYTAVKLPACISSFSALSFDSADISSIEIADNDTYFVAEDGIVYKHISGGKLELVMCPPANKTITSFSISSDVSKIGAGAFRNCTSLTALTLSSAITDIPDYAFKNTSLSSLVIGSTVKSIGTEAISGTKDLVVEFTSNPPKMQKAAITGTLKLHSSVFSSWLSGYDFEKLTWNGYPALVVYDAPSYVWSNYDSSFDTADKSGGMQYENSQWTSLYKNSLSIISDETLAFPGTLFDFSACITGKVSGGLVVLANESASDRIVFEYNPYTRAYELYRYKENSKTVMASGKASFTDASDSAELRVTVPAAGVLACFVNGTLCAYVNIEEYTENTYFGLYAAEAGLVFSELKSRVYGDKTFSFDGSGLTPGSKALSFKDADIHIVNNIEYDGASVFNAKALVTGESSGFIIAYTKDGAGKESYYFAYISAAGKLCVDKYSSGVLESHNESDDVINEYSTTKSFELSLSRDMGTITLKSGAAEFSYTDNGQVLNGLGYGFKGRNGSKLSSVEISFKNDYSKLELKDGCYVNRQGIRFTLSSTLGQDGYGTASVGLAGGETGNAAYSGSNYNTVIIPDVVRYNGTPYRVISIASKAFAGNEQLEYIKLPAGIKVIYPEAFKDCANLKKAIFLGEAPSSSSDMFTGCSSDFLIEILADNAASWGISHAHPAWQADDTQQYICVLGRDEDAYYYESVILDDQTKNNEKNLFFTLDEDSLTASLRDGKAASSYVEIPSAVVWKGKVYKVSSIGEYAFIGSSVTEVVIPESIESVETAAFQNCTALNFVSISGSNLTQVGSLAFEGCVSLSDCRLPDSVKSVGKAAFRGCSALQTIYLGKGRTEVSESEYENCSSVKSVSVSGDITTIGVSAFAGCSSLSEFTIPASVTTLMNKAFENCSSIKEILIPEELTNIANAAFRGCTSLETVTFEYKYFTSISDYCFADCTSLSEINLPKYVANIGDGAFENCSSLSEVSLPASLLSIGESAFSGCTDLSAVYFEGRKPELGKEAFGCDNGSVILFYDAEIDNCNWSNPYTKVGNQYYFTTYINDTYSGKNGSVIKYFALDSFSDDIWTRGNGSYKYISSANTDRNYSTALLRDIAPQDDSLVVFSADVQAVKDTASSYGLIFGAELNGCESFTFGTSSGYFFCINTDGTVSLYRYDGSKKENLGGSSVSIPGYDKTKTYNLRVQYDHRDGLESTSIRCYVNNVLFIDIDSRYEEKCGASLALCASGIKSIFSNVEYTELGNVLTYKVVEGSQNSIYDLSDMLLISGKALALVSNTDLQYGRLSLFEFQSSLELPSVHNDGINGMVFGYSDEVSEEGIRYHKYFTFDLELGTDGKVYVEIYKIVKQYDESGSRIADTQETRLVSMPLSDIYEENASSSAVAASDSLIFGIAWNGESEIDCYINSKWVFRYYYNNDGSDKDPVDGTGYGLISGSTGSSFEQTVVTVNGNASATEITEYSYLQYYMDTYTNIQNVIFHINSETGTASAAGLTYAAVQEGNISYIVIPDVVTFDDVVYKVTSIEAGAFTGVSLLGIELGDNIETIGDFAFSGCGMLTDIRMPASLKTIGMQAFSGCTSLESITLPDKLTAIGGKAFYGCSSLKSMHIPAAVSSIGDLAFGECASLEKFTVSENSSHFTAKADVLFRTDSYIDTKTGIISAEMTLIAYPVAAKRTSYNVPEGTTAIADFAFCNSALEDITLPSGLISIGSSAFAGSSVTELTIPGTVQNLGQYFCSGCFKLTHVKFESALAGILENIPEYAFSSCISLESIELPSGLKSISDYAFLSCSSLKELSLPDTLISMGMFVLDNCSGLESLNIGSSLRDFSGVSVGKCENLAKIHIDSENAYLSADEYGVVYDKEMTTLLCMPASAAIKYYAVPSSVQKISACSIISSAAESIYLPEGTVIDNTAYPQMGEGYFNFGGYEGTVITHDASYFIEKELDNYILYSQLSPEGIVIKALPQVREFTLGTAVDLSELVVYKEYTKGDRHFFIPDSSYTLSYTEAAGKVPVTVKSLINDEEYTASFSIWFNEAGEGKGTVKEIRTNISDTISVVPTREKEDFDLSELVVEAVYDYLDENGDEAVLQLSSDQYSVDCGGFDSTVPGIYTFTVTYRPLHEGDNYVEYVALFKVEVADRIITGASFIPFSTTEYIYGADFDASGMALILRYNTGESEMLSFGKDYNIVLLSGEEFSTMQTGRFSLKVVISDDYIISDEILAGIQASVPSMVQVSPLPYEKPDAPELISSTKNSIAVRVPPVNEFYTYMVGISSDPENEDSWTWVKADEDNKVLFTGLDPDSEYTVRSRVYIDSNLQLIFSMPENNELPVSDTVSFKTSKLSNDQVPSIPDIIDMGCSANARLIKLIPVENESYDKNVDVYDYLVVIKGQASGTWKRLEEDTLISLRGNTDYLIYLRYAEVDHYEAGEASLAALFHSDYVTSTAPELDESYIVSISASDIVLSYSPDGKSYRIGLSESSMGDWIKCDETKENIVINGLNADTLYYLQLRVDETAYNTASEPGSSLCVRTLRTAPSEPTYTSVGPFIINMYEAAEEKGLYEYKVVWGETESGWTGASTLNLMDLFAVDAAESFKLANEEYTIYRRLAAVTDSQGSVIKKASLSSSGIKVTTDKMEYAIVEGKAQQAPVLSSNAIFIIIDNENYEYSIDGGYTWSSQIFEAKSSDGESTNYIMIDGLKEGQEVEIIRRMKADDHHYSGNYISKSDKNYEKYVLRAKTLLSLNKLFADESIKPVFTAKASYGNTLSVQIAEEYQSRFDFTWTSERYPDGISGISYGQIGWQDMTKDGISFYPNTIKLTISAKNNEIVYTGSYTMEIEVSRASLSISDERYPLSELFAGAAASTYSVGEPYITVTRSLNNDYYENLFEEDVVKYQWCAIPEVKCDELGDEWYSGFGSECRFVDGIKENSVYHIHVRYAESFLYEASEDSLDYEISVPVQISEPVSKNVTWTFNYQGFEYTGTPEAVFGKSIEVNVPSKYTITEKGVGPAAADNYTIVHEYTITEANKPELQWHLSRIYSVEKVTSYASGYVQTDKYKTGIFNNEIGGSLYTIDDALDYSIGGITSEEKTESVISLDSDGKKIYKEGGLEIDENLVYEEASVSYTYTCEGYTVCAWYYFDDVNGTRHCITLKEIGPVEKAEQNAPSAPVLKQKYPTGVVLEAIEALDGKTVIYVCSKVTDSGLSVVDTSKEPVFTGLDPGSEYVFTAYFEETGTHKRSDESTALSVTTDKLIFSDSFISAVKELITSYVDDLSRASANTVSSGIKFNITDLTEKDIEFSFNEDQMALIGSDSLSYADTLELEYRIKGSEDWCSGSFEGLVFNKEYSFEFRIKGTSSTEECSSEFTYTTPKKARTAAPYKPSLALDDATLRNKLYSDGFVIVNYTQELEYEYRLIEADIEKPADGDYVIQDKEEFTKLKPNTKYYVWSRYKETEDYQASDWSEVFEVTTERKVQNEVPDPDLFKAFSTLTESITSDSIELKEFLAEINDVSYEYMLKGADGYESAWTTAADLSFIDLGVYTEYELYARLAQTHDYKAGQGVKIAVLTTKKLTQSAPQDSPVASIITESSVTLNPDALCQFYCIKQSSLSYDELGQPILDESLWQDSNIFNNLEKDTQYCFFKRYKATEKDGNPYYASDAGSYRLYTTHPLNFTGNVTIDSTVTRGGEFKYCFGAKLTVNVSDTTGADYDGLSYSWYAIVPGQADVKIGAGVNFTVSSAYIGEKIYVVVTGDAACSGRLESEVIELTKGYNETPSSPEAAISGTTITIKNSKANYAYSIDGGKTWISSEGGDLILERSDEYNIYPGNVYEVCCKVLGDEKYFDSDASAAVSLTAEKNSIAAPSINVSSKGADYISIKVDLGYKYWIEGSGTPVTASEDNTELISGVYVMKFRNLLPGTAYKLCALIPETEFFASAEASLNVETELYKGEKPSAPTLVSATDSGLVFSNPNNLYEFALADKNGKQTGDWQSGVFGELETYSKYYVICRFKAVEGVSQASDPSDAAEVMTAKHTAPVPEKAKLTATDDTITVSNRNESCVYVLVKGKYDCDFSDVPEAAIVGEYTGTEALDELQYSTEEQSSEYTVFVYTKETDSYSESRKSEASFVTMKVRYFINIFYYNENKEKVSEASYGFCYGSLIDDLPESFCTNKYIYTVKSYDNLPEYAMQNATVTCNVTSEYINYKVIFKNDSQIVSENNEAHYGDLITAPEGAMTKASTATLNFKFKGWALEGDETESIIDFSSVNVTGDAVYVAVYDSSIRYYRVVFLDSEGNESDVRTVEYLQIIEAPSVSPEKASDDTFSYSFDHWEMNGEYKSFPRSITEDGIVFTPCFQAAYLAEGPEAEQIEEFSISLKAKEGYEYSINDGPWTENNVFDGLEIDTEYRFRQRKAASGVEAAGEISRVVSISTAKPQSEYSGSCSSDGTLTWTLNTDACILIIEGSGSFTDYAENGAPWFAYSKYVKQIMFIGSCNTIGAHSLDGCMVEKIFYTLDGWELGSSISNEPLRLIPVEKHSNHSEGTAWVYDDTNHWHECICGIRFSSKNHIWTTTKYVSATCSSEGSILQTCKVCGAEKTQVIPMTEEHVYTDWQLDNSDRHYRTCINCGSVDYEAHKWDSGKIVTEASCAQAGTIEYTCLTCGGKIYKDIPKLETHSFGAWLQYDEAQHRHICSVCGTSELQAHEWDAGTVIKASSETEHGTRTYTCRLCSQTKDEELPLAEHTHSYSDSWSSDANNHWHECSCGDKSALDGHSWDEGQVVTQATCAQSGLIKYTCTVCGYEKTEEISRLQTHSYGSWIKNDADTHKHICLICKVEETKAHEWNAGEVIKESTTTEHGIRRYTCTVCGETKEETMPLANHEHSYSSNWTYDSSNHWHSCGECGDRINIANHSWDNGTVVTNATCAQKGSIKYECTVCGMIKYEDIPMLESHSWGSWKSVDSLNHKRVCSVCKAEEIKAHEWDAGTVIKASTETENGTRRYTCTVCGDTYEEQLALSDHTHSYGSEWIHDNSNHWHVCKCGDKSDLANHSYDEGVVTKAASHTEEGIMTFTCTVCGESYTKSIEKTAKHTYNQMNTDSRYIKSLASCTKQAVYYYSCVCGQIGTETFTDGSLLPHNYNQQVRTDAYKKSDANCLFGTVYYYSCECGAKGNITYEVGAPAGHDYGQWITAQDSDCTQTGWIAHYHCSVCGKDFNADKDEITGDISIEKLSHILSNWVSGYAASCDSDGLKGHYYCSRCEKNYDQDMKLIENIVIPAAHSFEYFERVEPSEQGDGHIEYWHCTVCGKYFSDSGCTQEITLADTVLPWITYIEGDFNGDGIVSDSDAVYLLYYTFFEDEYPITQPGDMNGDGIVSDSDAVYLLYYTFFENEYPLPSQKAKLPQAELQLTACEPSFTLIEVPAAMTCNVQTAMLPCTYTYREQAAIYNKKSFSVS